MSFRLLSRWSGKTGWAFLADRRFAPRFFRATPASLRRADDNWAAAHAPV